MALWSKDTSQPPRWASSVRTAKGWQHAKTGEILVAFGDTSYVLPTSSTAITTVKLDRNRKKFKTGDVIQIQSIFNEPVVINPVSGNPSIAFNLNGTAKVATLVTPDPGVKVSELLFNYEVQPGDSCTAGQFSLGSTASAVAAHTFGSGTAGFIVTAKAVGTGGNSITVALVQSGNSTPLSVSVASSAITVHLATDSGGAITSTAGNVLTAINGNTPASALVLVTLVSTGVGVVAAISATNLTGGITGTSSTGLTLPGSTTIKDVNGVSATVTYAGVASFASVTVN